MPEKLQRRFVDTLSSRAELVRAALPGVEAGDEEAEETVRRVGHVLKGSGASYGFPDVTEAGAAVEEAPSGEPLHRATRELLELLEKHLAELRPAERSRILVAEDDPEIAHLLEVVLADGEREVRVVPTASGLIDEAGAFRPHLVVLDLVLPDSDGRNALMRLRERSPTADVPVVMLSTRTSERVKAECFALGADAYFEKPFDPETLLSAVNARVQRRTEVERQEGRDHVTGCLNRGGLREALQDVAPDEPVAVVQLGLDGYERVVSAQGWEVAEGVLRTVGEALERVAEDGGARVGRWEASEFTMLLHGERADGARATAESAVEAVRGADLRDADGEVFHLTASAGLDRRERAAEVDEVATLVEAARTGLFLAREAGGNRVGADDTRPDGAAPTILVAEDDDLTARLLEHRLGREGLEVVRHANGRDAYDAAREMTPDLVILDVKMPGMDGFELLARLRRIPAYREIPIMLLTSLGNESDLVRGFELGADDYVLKPFSPAELLARVRRLLERRDVGRG